MRTSRLRKKTAGQDPDLVNPGLDYLFFANPRFNSHRGPSCACILACMRIRCTAEWFIAKTARIVAMINYVIHSPHDLSISLRYGDDIVPWRPYLGIGGDVNTAFSRLDFYSRERLRSPHFAKSSLIQRWSHWTPRGPLGPYVTIAISTSTDWEYVFTIDIKICRWSICVVCG